MMMMMMMMMMCSACLQCIAGANLACLKAPEAVVVIATEHLPCKTLGA
jgi:hypothetical protein